MGSLAGGLARKVEEALTIPLVKNLVDDIMVVSEESSNMQLLTLGRVTNR
jgi:threonine dehydratase